MSYFRLPHHCYSVGGQQLLRAQGSDVRHVDKHVNEGDSRDGDGDCPWEIPGRITQVCAALDVTLGSMKEPLTKHLMPTLEHPPPTKQALLPGGVHQLLCDVVEKVPASVSKRSLQD